ncbi:methyltransferase family protein [Granulicella arctica]|uniref:Protein-S-isoprenylcysteine O-methyltransferase Ste14 n=1 Tax=Granulicella arctica TaxID=940613 RepID=A0A7Y9PFB7_9BACT|nr:isoprenylcysteine carboxylmethyltransferase family protein [Granulicella arctica]NYF78645.1 protein-S-isoprenylcysteine O-methyltransferase Ste14 [Granulicella arctica]
MKATGFEFRFRFAIHCLIYFVGFAVYAIDPHAGSSWLLGAVYLLRTGVFTLSSATIALLSVGIAGALAGAWLRTWGAAYLSSSVVKDSAMHGAGVVADGPYRYLRNPLYLGTWLHTWALALLMPVWGAVFTLVAIGIFQVRLILAEEPFLRAKLGEPYGAYCALVPRVLPSVKARVAGAGARARWGQAFLGEIYFWGVAGSFAAVGWLYNTSLLERCVLVSLGVSLVARAFIPKKD